MHFTTLSTNDGTTVKYEKYSALIGILSNEFEQRFADFKEHCDELKLFSDPFSIDVNDVHTMFQLELIDFESDSDLKKAFAEHDLQTFIVNMSPQCPIQISHNMYFVSLHCLEVKTHTRYRLTDEHLSGILRIATSSVPADIGHLCKQKQCQTSHKISNIK